MGGSEVGGSEVGKVEGRRGRRSEMLERSKFREVGEIKDVGEAGKGGVRRSEGSEVGGAEEVYAACRMTYDAWRALHEIRGKEMGEKGGERRRRKGQKGGRSRTARTLRVSLGTSPVVGLFFFARRALKVERE